MRQVKIVIACCILHNYIMQVDLDDIFINEDVNFDEGPREAFDEEMEFSTRNMTVQHIQCLNQPIEKYEELRIICGEDMANGEFMGTNYDMEEDNEPKPINLHDDDGPIEIPSLQDNGGGVASQNMIGKSSRPSRKRMKEDTPAVLV